MSNPYDVQSLGDDATHTKYNYLIARQGNADGVGNYPAIAATYVVFKEGTVHYVRNGTTGVLDYDDADAATAIQWAIDQASTAPNARMGGTILLKRGTYTISTTLDLLGRTRLLGECGSTKNPYGTILVPDVTPVVKAATQPAETRVDNLEFSHISIIDSGATYAHVGLDLTLARFAYVHDCYFDGLGTGVYITQGGFYNLISLPFIDDCTTGVHITNVVATANSNTIWNGAIVNCTTGVLFTGGTMNCVLNVGFESNTTGLSIDAGIHHRAFACRFESNTTAIAVAGAPQHSQVFAMNYFSGNTTEISGTPGVNSRVSYNTGYITDNAGTGSIANGTTTDVITHGCDYTPAVADITVTLGENPTNTPGAIWVDTITATQFTVNCENDPGASNLDFSWSVRRL
jgi:hypothetical protein